MALVAAVFSLIPIFGSIASAVPAVAHRPHAGARDGGRSCSAWIVGIHQLEANVLNPKIMGDAAKIHPVLVIFSLLVGEHFFHVVGALLAVPAHVDRAERVPAPARRDERRRPGARARARQLRSGSQGAARHAACVSR